MPAQVTENASSGYTSAPRTRKWHVCVATLQSNMAISGEGTSALASSRVARGGLPLAGACASTEKNACRLRTIAAFAAARMVS